MNKWQLKRREGQLRLRGKGTQGRGGQTDEHEKVAPHTPFPALGFKTLGQTYRLSNLLLTDRQIFRKKGASPNPSLDQYSGLQPSDRQTDGRDT